MKYASVCSGVEAASLAWMPLGWKAAWFSEIEPFPCEVLKQRFPGVPNLGDMTKIKVDNLENGDQKYTNGDGAVVIVPGGVDLLVGGTPCQSFSLAGKREGLEGASGLARTFVELLGAMRPRWFVWENVPGCLSSRNKQTGIYDFNFLLAAFAEVGYSLCWKILDAQYCRIYGYPRAVPQRRRRVFVVGYSSGDWRYPAEVLFEPHSLSGNTPPKRVKRKGFTADAERSVGTASCFSSSCHGGYAAAAGTLKSSGGDTGGGSENLAISIGNGQVNSLINEHELAQTLNGMRDQQAVICLNDQGGSVMQVENDGNAGTLRANTHGNEQIVCVNGAEIPVTSTEHANPVTCNHNGLENAICYDARGNGNGDVAPTATGDHLNRITDYTPIVQECYSVDRRNQTLTDCSGGDNYNTVMEVIAIDQQGGKGNASYAHEVLPTIMHDSHGTPHAVAIAFEPGIAKREGDHSRFTQEVSSTLRSDMGDNQTSVAISSRKYTTVRRLLPIETERLMGFPDNWTRISWKGKPAEECPDSPRYKACGNSMCVNVMRWIGMRIEMLERRLK